jgi:hypothetical protein
MVGLVSACVRPKPSARSVNLTGEGEAQPCLPLGVTIRWVREEELGCALGIAWENIRVRGPDLRGDGRLLESKEDELTVARRTGDAPDVRATMRLPDLHIGGIA